MNALYLIQQGTTLAVLGEQITVKRGQEIIQSIQLPLLEYILLFG